MSHCIELTTPDDFAFLNTHHDALIRAMDDDTPVSQVRLFTCVAIRLDEQGVHFQTPMPVDARQGMAIFDSLYASDLPIAVGLKSEGASLGAYLMVLLSDFAAVTTIIEPAIRAAISTSDKEAGHGELV